MPPTAPELRATLAELLAFEPIFHRLAPGWTRATLEAMTAPDFHEIGASGRCYTRDFVIETVLARGAAAHMPPDWRVEAPHCQRLADDLYLLGYTLHQGPRLSRRSTVWRREAGGWVIVFHQGTLVQDA